MAQITKHRTAHVKEPIISLRVILPKLPGVDQAGAYKKGLRLNYEDIDECENTL